MLCNYSFDLINIDTMSAVGVTGKSFGLGSDTDPSFRLLYSIAMTGGASTPSVTLYVETSVDGETWVNAITPVEVTTTIKSDFIEVPAIGPMVRARTVLGGGTTPTYKARVSLTATQAINPVPKP